MSEAVKKPKNDLPYRMIIGWGIGTLPMAIYFNSFNILALRFFTDYVGLTAATAGLIIGLSKLYDAVTDPVMGTLSDRTRTPLGRRRPYILLGGVLCALSIFGLFSIPVGLNAQSAMLFVSIAVIVYATSYTVYNIPYMAMPSEISASGKTRSAMMSWRVACIGAGGLIAGALGPKIIDWAGGGSAGHSAMGIMLGVSILAFAIITFFMTKGAPDRASEQQADKLKFSDKLKTIMSNRPFMLLLGVKFFQLSGVAVSSATLAFFTVWILGRSYSDLGTIVFFTTLGQILGTPFWLAVTRRIGKPNTFFISAALFAAVSMTWLLADANEALWVTCIRVFAKGLATGGILLVGQALLPDTIEYDRLKTGMRREGVLSGMYTTIEKVSFAVGTMLTGIFLDLMNYKPMLRASQDAQAESAITAIYYCQSVIPAVSVAIAALFLINYKLSETELDTLRSSSDEPVDAKA